MPELSTKQKIINAATRLFNENGMANVRLQQIANDVGISAGNLAYHFRNKEAIVDAISEEVFEEISELLSAYRLFPNLMDFDYQLNKYYAFLEKYPFYFLDLLEIERNYPDIHSKQHLPISKMISQIRKRFDYNCQRGIIMEEPRPGIYDSTAEAIWILITFWMPQHILRNQKTNCMSISFKEMVWNQLYPFLTPKGIAEFEQLILPVLQQHSSDN